MKTMRTVAISLVALVLAACSDFSDPEKTHKTVWQTQVDGLRAAQDIGAVASDAAVQRARKPTE